MKAAQFSKYGGPSVIEINDVDEPKISENQVLVEVSAASINPIDYKVREGYLQNIPSSFPSTLSGDFAGVIKDAGNSNFKAGDKVYGQAGILNGGSGSMAEFAVASVSKIGPMPEIRFEDAASLPLAAVSALQALVDHIKLKGGQKILINGGAGGIGSFAVQIAKAIGAYVATTVSTEDVDFVKQLGADEVIDYKTKNVKDVLNNYDAVFDTAGPQTWDDSIMVLKKGGVIVSMNGQPNPLLAEEQGVTSIGQGTDSNPDKLAKIKEMIESGKIKPRVDKVFPLEEAREAFEFQEKESPKGKVVVKIK